MKTVTYNVYKYEELPTEEAKENARQWWIDLEAQDPAWIEEHFDSMRAAIDAAGKATDAQELREESLSCEWTGYCADGLLGDMIGDDDEIPSQGAVEDYYRQSWDNELSDRLNDREGIEEIIECNGYEFLEDGRFHA